MHNVLDTFVLKHFNVDKRSETFPPCIYYCNINDMFDCMEYYCDHYSLFGFSMGLQKFLTEQSDRATSLATNPKNVIILLQFKTTLFMSTTELLLNTPYHSCLNYYKSFLNWLITEVTNTVLRLLKHIHYLNRLTTL